VTPWGHPADPTPPVVAGDSLGSSRRSYSSRSYGGDSRYTDRDARRFREERDSARTGDYLQTGRDC
jgi:hypothetical protein